MGYFLKLSDAKLRRLRVSVLSIFLIPSMVSTFSMGIGATAETSGTQRAKITIAVDGNKWDVLSKKSTVKETLYDAGVKVSEKDQISPGLSTKVSNGMKISVARVTERIVTQKEPIKFKITTKTSYSAKSRSVIRKGSSGEKEVTYCITHKDGVETDCKVVKYKITKAPVNEVVVVPGMINLASRDGMYIRSLRMQATGYAPFACGGSRSGHAANGMRAGKGVVAVDTRVIRLGTKLYIEGYGYCVAGDRGGSIKGLRIDLGFDTYQQARRFGRHAVTVHIIP